MLIPSRLLEVKIKFNVDKCDFDNTPIRLFNVILQIQVKNT